MGIRPALVSILALCLTLSTAASSAQVPAAQWVEHLGFNVEVPPLDNVTLRQAIASAVDRQAVLEAVRNRLPRG